MQINPLLLITVGLAGGVGAVVRYLLASIKGWLPWGTLIANTIASVFAAAIVVLASGASFLEVSLVAGFAGGLSTFSTYAGQTYEFIRSRHWLQAIAYTIASFVIPSTGVLLVATFA
jgi:CrcB protein